MPPPPIDQQIATLLQSYPLSPEQRLQLTAQLHQLIQQRQAQLGGDTQQLLAECRIQIEQLFFPNAQK
ncbi:MAG: hypothetical protein KME20_06250 [Kaiparowitsia implicata GSE-PSE-MK54-09C]|nr:hypothetical protein [Kaiparowitsia implicata GSE-PSE-MK54-09C]